MRREHTGLFMLVGPWAHPVTSELGTLHTAAGRALAPSLAPGQRLALRPGGLQPG